MGLLVWGLFYLTYVTTFVLHFVLLHIENENICLFKDVLYSSFISCPFIDTDF